MKTMNFVDIASYQTGIDLEAVFAQNPLHGVIVKSTQGMTYVNKMCDPWVQWLIAHDKPWGFYHFLDYTDPVAEAKRFIRETENYWGHGVPAADFEGTIVNNYGTKYLRRFVETCYAEMGIKPLIYCNLGTIQRDADGFRTLAEDGYPLWLAQYKSMSTQNGFVDKPWQKGSFAPFEKLTMHQYSGTGRLNGYSGYIDLDLFYGNIEDWNRLADKDVENPSPSPDPAPEDDWLADWIEYLEGEKQRIQTKIDDLRRRLN